MNRVAATIPLSANNVPFERTFAGQHFSWQVPDIQAWESIRITGNLSTGNFQGGPFPNIVFRAPNIIVEPGVTIGPGITLISGLPDVCSGPIQQAPLGTFCSDGRYKANVANKSSLPDNLPGEEPDFPSPPSKSPLSAYPNPFTQELTLSFSLEAPGATSARLLDHLGRNVLLLWDAVEMEAGQQERTFDLSSLPAGLYLAVLETRHGRQTLRVVKY